MNCIIVDDEPLARRAIKRLIEKYGQLELVGSFNNATSVSKFISEFPVDLIFLDIRMPGITGIEFAKTILANTLVIFTTAYAEYALDSYEVDAIDYLVKPIVFERFQKAVDKAVAYHSLLLADSMKSNLESIAADYLFVKADRRFFKVYFDDIFFIEGLKDYSIIQTKEQRIITRVNLKTISDELAKDIFLRVSKSYIVNIQKIESFDNNDIFITKYEIPIGNAYRSFFFDEYVAKKVLNMKK
uniref:LytR/AlgR family response regulator transcription factor n=1 Tax=uncultured Bacteroides sp. TaxID=162156 RepID=UPI0025DCD04E|nr:LytTR family DNA-binding domain-containing protein [uncultured Bacteroides sp.]